MNKNFRLFFGAILLAGGISSCSTSTDPADAYKGETPHQIYMKGKIALQNKSYSEAVKRFEALEVQYPYDEDIRNAELFLIYAYYMKEDYLLSVAAADRFIKEHPTDPHVDYAYYMRGISDYYQNMGILERLFIVDMATRDLSQIRKSYSDFNELILLYPNSLYAPSAHQYMIYLRNVLAAQELHVGQYYYNRRAYVAAVNRGSAVVEQYQGAPCVVDALVLMAKSYRQLGQTKLEEDTLAVLNYNYPNIKINWDSSYSL